MQDLIRVMKKLSNFLEKLSNLKNIIITLMINLKKKKSDGKDCFCNESKNTSKILCSTKIKDSINSQKKLQIYNQKLKKLVLKKT